MYLTLPTVPRAEGTPGCLERLLLGRPVEGVCRGEGLWTGLKTTASMLWGCPGENPFPDHLSCSQTPSGLCVSKGGAGLPPGQLCLT